MLTSCCQTWLVVGALLGALSVGCGAFGAHGLKSRFVVEGQLSEAAQQKLANWETAARYQMYHALALLAIGLASQRQTSAWLSLAGGAMTLGTLIFSGCLYALVLSGQKWLGAIVPVGGALLIVGWVCLAVGVWAPLPAAGR